MKSILKFFNIKFLILGVVFGFIALHFSDSEKRTVHVYPTLENSGVIQYKDGAGNCFSFENIIVECPTDESQIHTIPVQ
mgnify:CR=1 FL=1|jgi:hypothetical protein